jgi:hypothetical protein
MATPAQITANRSNALSSTGPRSVEGKAASSRNSLKLGLTAKSLIIPGEDPAELDALSDQYMEEFTPTTVIEEHFVHAMIQAVWMQRRCDRIEAAYLNARVAALPEGTQFPLGAALVEDAAHGDVLHKIFRRRQAAERDWNNALATLADIQSERLQRELAAKRPPAPPRPDPNRVRFSNPPLPAAPRAPEAPENLALRL